MGFPVVPLASQGRVLTANQLNTTATRTFPALSGLTKNPGDLLIAIIVAYQTSTGTNAAFSGWSDGFTEFHDSATSTTLAMGAAYKWSDGTETAAPTVTQAATITGDASMILLSIPAAHASTPPEAGSRASGTTGAADPASFDPAGWGTEDTLWISVVGSGLTNISGSWTGTGTTAPTNYTDRVDTNASDTSTIGDCEAAVAFRQLNAGSEDVGTAGVDVSNARNGAFVIAVRAAPFAPNEDSETDVSPRRDVAPALTKAAVGLATAVAILNGFNFADEITQVIGLDGITESQSQEVVAIGRDPLPLVFVYDDDIVPQPVAAVFEDDGEVPQKPPGQRVSLMGPEWDDSVPARIVDEVYEWTQQGVAPRPIPAAVAMDDEIVPQPITEAIDEVYEVWPYVEPVEIIVSLSEPGGGPGAPDVAPQLADDEGWINEKAIARAVREAFTADDEIVPQPTAFGVDDDPWQVPIVQWRVDARTFLDDDLVVTQPGEFVPDEQYELQLFVEPFETRVQLSEPGGGGPATPPAGEPLGVDDLYWLQLRGYQRPAVLFSPPANDEITQPAIPGEGAGGFPLIACYSPEIVQWEIGDELPQPAAPLLVDEQYWAFFLVPQRRAILFTWETAADFVPQPAASPEAVGFNPLIASPGRLMNRR